VLLERLDSVRVQGDGSWRAKCPAHDSKRLSLSIAERDGKTLLYCFAGCGASDVVAALGLGLGDLFADAPEAQKTTRAGGIAVSAEELLAMLDYESQAVAIAAGDIVEGRGLSAADADRVATAHYRLRRARALFTGSGL